MFNKKKLRAIIGILILSIFLTSCSGNSTASLVRIQDDLYESVNEKWLEDIKIPEGEVSIGSFEEIGSSIENTLKSDFNKMLKDEKKVEDSEMEEFLKFYELALDSKRRNEDGTKPIMSSLEKIESLNSFDDISKNFKSLNLEGIRLPVLYEITPDMKNVDRKLMYFTMPDLILGDKEIYTDEKELKEVEKEYETMFIKMLKMVGKDETEAKKITERAFAFDEIIAPYAKSAEEESDSMTLYNPISVYEFVNLSESMNLEEILKSLLEVEPKLVVISDENYYRNLNKIINEDNFELIKSWMYLGTLYQASPYLSEEFEEVTSEISMKLSGIKKLKDFESRAYNLATSTFGDVVGQYYGKNYFEESAKKDVENMVYEFIETYEHRLENIDWLTDETKTRAIGKLKNLEVQIGYPEEESDIDSKIKVDSQKSLYENLKAISKVIEEDELLNINEPVDRSEWGIAAHEVNAIYTPTTNTITFPAAILQKPFYSTDYTDSENNGGIGAVIAHEISHAFDPNGAKFDEKGNLVDWWTKEDYEAFQKKIDAVVNQFDGFETEAGPVNGLLTVTENVADAGGISVALEVTKNLEDGNLEDFFKSWARIWRVKTTPEYAEQRLGDTHSPNKVRANVQASNLDDFYEVFNVKESDGMYLPKEERVKVW